MTFEEILALTNVMTANHFKILYNISGNYCFYENNLYAE